jgi:putative PIN family toxin of toxin-antitoxin system
MIAVIDTNIWISAFFFGGNPELAVLKAAREGIIAICPEIEAEVLDLAVRKFAQHLHKLQPRFNLFLRHALYTQIYGSVKVCRDPKDNMVLECAQNAGASLIVSGDKDLLALGTFEGVRILTARQYVDGGPFR